MKEKFQPIIFIGQNCNPFWNITSDYRAVKKIQGFREDFGSL
jgi:hypothetical protein